MSKNQYNATKCKQKTAKILKQTYFPASCPYMKTRPETIFRLS